MKNIIQKLIEIIKTKNSWEKNELLLVLTDLLAEEIDKKSETTVDRLFK